MQTHICMMYLPHTHTVKPLLKDALNKRHILFITPGYIHAYVHVQYLLFVFLFHHVTCCFATASNPASPGMYIRIYITLHASVFCIKITYAVLKICKD